MPRSRSCAACLWRGPEPAFPPVVAGSTMTATALRLDGDFRRPRAARAHVHALVRACDLRVAPASLLPAPQTVFLRLSALLGDPQFLAHCAVTLFRLFTGFCHRCRTRRCLRHCRCRQPARWARRSRRSSGCSRRCRRSRSIRLRAHLGFRASSKIALVVADAVFPILLATYQGAIAVEPKLVWSARAAGVRALRCCSPSCRGGSALDHDRLPHRAGHLLHRGLPVGDDHLDRRPRAPSGARGAQLPDRRHVRADHRHLASGPCAQCRRSMHCARGCCSAIRRKTECWPTGSKASGSTPSARFSSAAA